MASRQSPQRSTQVSLACLEQSCCRYCADRTLEVATYKKNAALVCDACGTPRAQFWNDSRDAATNTKHGGPS